MFGLLLKTGLLLLLRAASVCYSCFSSVGKPVFLYSLPAGPAGVHCHGSARALHRVGPRQAPAQQEGAAVAVPGWRKRGWERVVGSEEWGGDGEGGGVGTLGSEGWRSKVRVEPAAPAAKVAPLPKPDPPFRSRRLNVGECFCIREILFRTQCRAGSTLSLSVPPSLLNALALRRSDRSYQFHPPRHEYGLVPPAHGGTRRPTRGAGTAGARKVGTVGA